MEMTDIEENRTHKENASPTPWELEHLTRVPDDIKWTIYLIAVAELAERFTYRCVTAPLRKLSSLFRIIGLIASIDYLIFIKKTMFKMLARIHCGQGH